MQYREILVLHPNPSIRGLLEGYLHSEFEDVLVVEAESGAQAENLLSEQRFDLIIGSSKLSDMLGVQLYVSAKRTLHNANTPFIMIVDAGSREPSSLFYQHGIEHVLHLPFTSDHLQQKVRQLTNPRDKRKIPRYSYPDIHLKFELGKADCAGRVVNMSSSSVLSEISCQTGFPEVLSSRSLDLSFPAAIDSIEIKDIQCQLSRVRVLKWDEQNGPVILRVAWSFPNLEGPQARLLDQALGKIEQAYSQLSG